MGNNFKNNTVLENNKQMISDKVIKEKIEYLIRYGYKVLNDELLNEIRKSDYKLFRNILNCTRSLENKGDVPTIVIFFRNTFCIYTLRSLQQDTEQIIEGTRRFLTSLEIKPNETDFLLI